MKLIYLEWADAHTNAGWFFKEDAELWADKTDWFIKECGWIIKETDKYICIAEGLKPENEFESMQFVNLHKIPKTWIKKRKLIKL